VAKSSGSAGLSIIRANRRPDTQETTPGSGAMSARRMSAFTAGQGESAIRVPAEPAVQVRANPRGNWRLRDSAQEQEDRGTFEREDRLRNRRP
jgi:hypothetical protein